MSPTYNVIRQTMLSFRPIAFDYQGYRREVCAHVIGTKNRHEQVLTFQFGGGSKSGLGAGGQWRCMPIGGISNIEVLTGAWATGPNTHQKTQTCVDQVDVELWVDAIGTPYVKRA